MTRPGSLHPIALATALLVVASCGSAGSGAPAPTTVAPSTPAAITATATSGSPTADSPTSDSPTSGSPTAASGTPASTTTTWAGGEVACGQGGTVALASFALATGDVGWRSCSSALVWRRILGASADVVALVETGPADGASPSPADLVGVATVDGHEVWRVALAAPQGPWPTGDATAGGIGAVLVAGTDHAELAGLELTTGAARWRAEPRSDPVAHGPDVVILGSTTGSLQAIDRRTAVERWVSPSAGGVDSAVVEGDVVVAAGSGGTLAVDLATGVERWRGEALQHLVAGAGVVVGQPPQDGPRDMGIRALDIATGATRWSAPGKPSYGGVWAADGASVVVLVPPFNIGGITSYALADGALRWHQPNPVGEPQLVVSDGGAVLVWEGALAVLDGGDGSTRWQRTDPLGTPMMSSVGANDTTLFVAVNSRPWGD